MLKQLRLKKELEVQRNKLNELLLRKAGFEKRSKDLETALEEAKTDEDIKLVDESIEALEKEIEEASIETNRASVEAEINRIETELADLDARAKEIKDEQQRNTSNITEKREGGNRMSKRGMLFSMNSEERSAFVSRSEVKDFLLRVRDFKGQQRTVTGAELTIPDVMIDLLRDNLHKYSKLISKVLLKPVKGKARQNIAGSIPEGIWTEAVGSLNELLINFNQVEVDGYKVGGFIPVPNATLEDSDINLASEILDMLGQAIGLGADKAILFGKGTKMPLGIATRLAQTAQPSDWNTKAPAWTDLHTSNIVKIDPTNMTAEQFFAALIEKLGIASPKYAVDGTFWCMNRKTKMKLLSKSINFNAAGALVAGQQNVMPVEGGEIIELEFIADNDIIGGFGSLYLLAEREGAAIDVSEHVKFIEDMTVFRGTARYDGEPVFGEGFVIVNIANTNPTTSVAFAPDTANPSDAYLSSLSIGGLTLSPSFSGAVGNYTATTTNATNVINAKAAKTGATVVIKNGETVVENGTAATWATGANTVTITVTYGTTNKSYTVVVTK